MVYPVSTSATPINEGPSKKQVYVTKAVCFPESHKYPSESIRQTVTKNIYIYFVQL